MSRLVISRLFRFVRPGAAAHHRAGRRLNAWFLGYWTSAVAGCAALSFTVVGCGAEMTARYSGSKSESTRAPAGGQDVAGGESASPRAPASDRKLIYESELHLAVGDFDKVEAEIPKLVEKHKAYLGNVTIDRTRGDYRTGRWLVRVPVANHAAFLADAARLGVPETQSQTVQDVTEEFFDLETRAANSKKLEARILQLAERKEGEIKDLVEIERELNRVRTEIEQLEGRLRYLANRTDFSSVTIVAREQRAYQPPQAPTLLGRVTAGFSDSLETLRRFFEGLLVLLVVLSPWLALAGLAIGAVWLTLRLRLRPRGSSPSNVT